MADYSYADERHCPKGNGGNSTITNQDERKILEKTATSLPVRTEGAQEGQAH